MALKKPIVFLLFAFLFLSYAQSSGQRRLLQQPESYFIPEKSDSVRIIRLNFIFMQKNDGSGNFQQTDSAHQEFWDRVEVSLNNVYRHVRLNADSSCYTGKHALVADARIGFEVHRLYVRNTYGWDNKGGNLCPSVRNWYLNPVHDSINALPGVEPAINVFFTEDAAAYRAIVLEKNCADSIKFSLADCSMFPSRKRYQELKVHMPNEYTKFVWMRNCATEEYGEPWKNVRNWAIWTVSKCLAHELGHSLGLVHNNSCPDNLMHAGGFEYFLSPDEIARIHKKLHTTSLRKYVK